MATIVHLTLHRLYIHILQIIQAICRNPKDQTKVSLIFANVSVEDILLKETLDELASKHDNFTVYYVLNKVNISFYYRKPFPCKIIYCYLIYAWFNCQHILRLFILLFYNITFYIIQHILTTPKLIIIIINILRNAFADKYSLQKNGSGVSGLSRKK
jgi:hypothetical protein